VTLDAAASSPARLRIVRFYDISAEICDRCSAAARLWISRKKVPPPLPPSAPFILRLRAKFSCNWDGERRRSCLCFQLKFNFYDFLIARSPILAE